MSKNINVNLNPFKIVAIALVAMALSTNSVVWGQTTQNPVNMFTDYVFGLLDFYYPGEGLRTEVSWVGNMKGEHYFEPSYFSYLGPGIVKLVRDNFPADHITRAGNVVEHVAGNHINSMMMFINPNAVPSFVDVEVVVNRLHDTAYTNWGYAKVAPNASIDPSMLCHGYSTGLNTWMYGMGTWLADEYEFTNFRDNLVPGAIFFRPPIPNNPITVLDSPYFGVSDHSSRVVAVQQLPETHDLRVTVIEKNRVSALYTKEFRMKAMCPNDDYTKCDGKCGMVLMSPTDLPWLPIGFYKKKP